MALAWMHAEALKEELPLAELPKDLRPADDLLRLPADVLESRYIHDPPPWYVLEKWLKRQARTVYYHTPAGRIKRRISLQEAIARAEADRPRVLQVLEGAEEHRAIEPQATQ